MPYKKRCNFTIIFTISVVNKFKVCIFLFYPYDRDSECNCIRCKFIFNFKTINAVPVHKQI